MLEMERDPDSKSRIQNSNSPSSSSNNNNGNVQRSKSFAFRAPQENFTIQDFELGKIYGVGSYSKVVRAKKKDTGIVYALKIMDKKFITKENKTAYVKLERIVLDQLDHPGIVRLYFTFQDNYSLYMALESCEGGELFDQITRKGRLSEDEARFYAAEVVDALEYIHSMGLIHRDIKPENLLFTADGHIKIADFGSVKPMQDSCITVLPNAASDDKACTFVGTAAYVPPEVLNSSPATFGNDLWALGCTLYQMLSGTSPFKDASEWLIFQRIIARDLRFPDYFSEEARDLIDHLLDIDPSRRPGAGRGGYAVLKNHPFFEGVDWKNLRGETPPKLFLEPMAQSSDNDHDPGSPFNPTHIGDSSMTQNDANVGVSSSAEATSHITRLASIDSFDSKWQQFLDPGESVVMISMVKKLQKLTSKKVQLILTNKPKLIYVDPSKLIVKGNIIWSDNSDDLSVQVTSPSHFKICTPKKVRSFEDVKQRPRFHFHFHFHFHFPTHFRIHCRDPHRLRLLLRLPLLLLHHFHSRPCHFQFHFHFHSLTHFHSPTHFRIHRRDLHHHHLHLHGLRHHLHLLQHLSHHQNHSLSRYRTRSQNLTHFRYRRLLHRHRLRLRLLLRLLLDHQHRILYQPRIQTQNHNLTLRPSLHLHHHLRPSLHLHLHLH